MLSARDTEDGYECHISGKRVFILRTTGSHLVDSLLGCVPRNEDTPIADHAEATLEHRISIVDVLRMMITTPLVNTHNILLGQTHLYGLIILESPEIHEHMLSAVSRIGSSLT